MPSNYETFFDHDTYAVVGHSAHKPFPILTLQGLKRRGKTVFAIDPSAGEIDGEPTHKDLESLPSSADAAVLELPREETREWVDKVARAGIKNLWLHMNSDSPEALSAAREHGINVRYGTCAVQYVNKGFPHNVHKLIRRILRRY